jgi:hypothetical protein
MADEHSFVRKVHRYLPDEVYKWKINARFVRGVPDAWYSGPGGDLWVEYKYLSRTPAHAFTPQLSAHQAKWLRERHNEGRQVAVVVGCPQGSVVLTDREWERQVAVPDTWNTARGVAKWITQQTSYMST